MWDDVIGEPEGLRSTQCAWNCSYKCFRGTRNCCYILLVMWKFFTINFSPLIDILQYSSDNSFWTLPSFLLSHQLCLLGFSGNLWKYSWKANFKKISFKLQHIWCLGPCLRTWKINCAFIRNCLSVSTIAWWVWDLIRNYKNVLFFT